MHLVEHQYDVPDLLPTQENNALFESKYTNSSKENNDIRFRSDNLTQEKLTEQSKGLSEEAAETQISELSDKMKTKVLKQSAAQRGRFPLN